MTRLIVAGFEDGDKLKRWSFAPKILILFIIDSKSQVKKILTVIALFFVSYEQEVSSSTSVRPSSLFETAMYRKIP